MPYPPNRWTKAVVLAAAFAITGCGPQQARDARLLELKAKCRDDVDKAQAAWKRWYAWGYQNWSNADQYAYSPKLNTCLWSGEYEYNSPHNAGEHGKLVLDVYANKILLNFWASKGTQMSDMSEGEFERRKAELMGSAIKEPSVPRK